MVTMIISVTAASYNFGSKIGEVEARIFTLETFANQGDRWTAKDGLANRTRILKLEEDMRELPPDWFVKQHDETRQEVKELSGEVHKLEQAVKDLMSIISSQHEEMRSAR